MPPRLSHRFRLRVRVREQQNTYQGENEEVQNTKASRCLSGTPNGECYVLFYLSVVDNSVSGNGAVYNCDILRDHTKVVHGSEHDLESLFYVLIWICTNQAGPNGLPRTDLQFDKDIPVLNWIDPARSYRQVAQEKVGQCAVSKIFESDILSFYHGYFEDLKECSRQLRVLFFNNMEKKATHDEMLVIFQDSLANLPEEPVVVTPIDEHPALFFQPITTKSTPTSLKSVDEDEYEDEDEDVDVDKRSEGEAEDSDGEPVEGNVDDKDIDEYPVYSDDDKENVFGIPRTNTLAHHVGVRDAPILKRKRDDAYAEVRAEGSSRRPRTLSESH